MKIQPWFSNSFIVFLIVYKHTFSYRLYFQIHTQSKHLSSQPINIKNPSAQSHGPVFPSNTLAGAIQLPFALRWFPLYWNGIAEKIQFWNGGSGCNIRGVKVWAKRLPNGPANLAKVFRQRIWLKKMPGMDGISLTCWVWVINR